MSQFGESAFIPPKPQENKKEPPKKQDKKPLKMRLSVFFDGTGNNRANIDQRKGYTRAGEEHLNASEQTYYKLAIKQKKGTPKGSQTQELAGTASGSYEAEYSNIVYLQENFKATTEHDINQSFYIEGVGTQDLLAVSKSYENASELYDEIEDTFQDAGIDKQYMPPKPKLALDSDVAGMAMAKGVTGLYAKMDAALDKIQDWFYEYLEKKEMSGDDFFIEEIVIDVFGFSRGAATARAFIDYIQTGKRTLISVVSMRNGKKIESKVVETPSLTKHISNNCDIDTSQAKIVIGFAGLFDTVSAHNIALLSDVEKLKLDEVKQARFTYHLTSSEEHRGCFSLTDISAAKALGKGKEYFLPGVHSDIGGGYRGPQAEVEEMTVARLTNLPSLGVADNLTTLGNTLVNEGWYKTTDDIHSPLNYRNHQLQLVRRKPMGIDAISYVRAIKVHREHMQNTYSLIPLNLMAEEAKQHGFTFLTKFKFKHKVPSSLKAVDNAIRDYISCVGNGSKPEDWFIKNNAHINHKLDIEGLRYQHLHYSAKMAIGHWPRFKQGKRYREQYKG